MSTYRRKGVNYDLLKNIYIHKKVLQNKCYGATSLRLHPLTFIVHPNLITNFYSNIWNNTYLGGIGCESLVVRYSYKKERKKFTFCFGKKRRLHNMKICWDAAFGNSGIFHMMWGHTFTLHANFLFNSSISCDFN